MIPGDRHHHARAAEVAHARLSRRGLSFSPDQKKAKEKDPAGNYGATPFDILSSDARRMSQHGFS
jgi:hypothetical protein